MKIPRAEIDLTACGAGRYAYFGGRWKLPCPGPAPGEPIHVIGTDGGWEMRFCEQHFQELLAAGLVEQPYVSREGFEKLTGRRLR